VRTVARLSSNQSPALSSSVLAFRIQNLSFCNALRAWRTDAFERLVVEITTRRNLALEPDRATAKSNQNATDRFVGSWSSNVLMIRGDGWRDPCLSRRRDGRRRRIR
jgi:hypothetical protein